MPQSAKGKQEGAPKVDALTYEVYFSDAAAFNSMGQYPKAVDRYSQVNCWALFLLVSDVVCCYIYTFLYYISGFGVEAR